MSITREFCRAHFRLTYRHGNLEIYEQAQGKNFKVWYVFYGDSLLFDGHAPDDAWYVQQFMKEGENELESDL